MSKGNKPYYDIKDAPVLFEKFTKDYNRNYKDEADRQEHFQAFIKTLKSINKANAESSHATFDINKFADYTPEERKNMFGLNLREEEK
ncbi:seminal fluid protein HACP057 [Danaus plexippus plexippus]|uniref:Seminal fluid protein HACP057 n=1 Tax=Danaus plexippus plexippus TaxID=278856 RepID=A0A212FL79_DANPL|nr:seminal fluid protein HACP057 [Danaus plexippus plexippus]